MEEVKNIFLNKTMQRRKSFGLTQLFHYYHRNLSKEEKNSVYDVSKEVWTAIITTYLKELFRKILYEGYVARLGSHLGEVFISREKIRYEKVEGEDGRFVIRGAKVNLWETIKLWHTDAEARAKKLKIYYLNEHTDGYRLGFVWNQFRCLAKNKKGYKFVACRTLRKELYHSSLKDLLPKDYCLRESIKEQKLDKKFKKFRKNVVWENARKKLELQEI